METENKVKNESDLVNLDVHVGYLLEGYAEDHEFSKEELNTILVEYSGVPIILGEFIKNRPIEVQFSSNGTLPKDLVAHYAKESVLVQWKKDEDAELDK